MISGHGTIETAVASIKKGAYDFIEKPFKADRLIHVCERALEAARLKREVQELKLRAGDDHELIGTSSAISQLRQAVEKIAPTGSRVLITGQSGAGKEVVARLIHAHSRRAANAFVAINCATMAPDRIEAELFGEEIRRRLAQDRPVRGRPQRHALSRRSLRHAAGDPGQDPARAGRPDLPARRRHRRACRSMPG